MSRCGGTAATCNARSCFGPLRRRRGSLLPHPDLWLLTFRHRDHHRAVIARELIAHHRHRGGPTLQPRESRIVIPTQLVEQEGWNGRTEYEFLVSGHAGHFLRQEQGALLK